MAKKQQKAAKPVKPTKPSKEAVKAAAPAKKAEKGAPVGRDKDETKTKAVVTAKPVAGAKAAPAPKLTKAAKPMTGLPYDTIADLKDVVQLDKLDGDRVVILTGAGLLDTVPLP